MVRYEGRHSREGGGVLLAAYLCLEGLLQFLDLLVHLILQLTEMSLLLLLLSVNRKPSSPINGSPTTPIVRAFLYILTYLIGVLNLM